MNTLESITMTSPFGEEEECAKFTIDEVLSPFVLHDITVIGEQYTLSFWVKSDVPSEVLLVRQDTITTTTEWAKHVVNFEASTVELKLYFNAAGTYYIYHPQLEIGNKATDWTPAVEDMATGEDVDILGDDLEETNKKLDDTDTKANDAMAQIQILDSMIANLVTDENGASLMTQTADGGWTFDISGLEKNLGNANETLNQLIETVNTLNTATGGLQSAVENLETTSEYVWVTTYEDEPCLALGESDTTNGLFITNTRIIFIKEGGSPTYITKDGMYTDKFEVGTEFRHKDYVWAVRSNGNYGLSWKQIELTGIQVIYVGDENVIIGTALSDLTGVVVRGTYSNDTMRSIIYGYELSGEIVEGENVITVTYEGFTGTFIVTGIALESITVEYTGGDMPVGTTSRQLTGITVTAHYADGSSKIITDYTIAGSVSEVGENTFIVNYNGKGAIFTVIGYAVPDSILATYSGGSVIVGSSLDDLKTNLTVTLHYSDGSTSVVSSSDYTLSGTIAEGSNTITVTYGDFTTTFTVNGVVESGYELVYGASEQYTVVLWMQSNTATSMDVQHSDSVEVVDGAISLVNPTTTTFYKTTHDSYSSNNYDALLGEYILIGGSCYYILPTSTYKHNYVNNTYVSENIVYNLTQKVTIAS